MNTAARAHKRRFSAWKAEGWETYMTAALLAVALLVLTTPQAFADEQNTLRLRSKSAIAVVVPHRSAPFTQPIGEPEREPLFSRHDPRDLQSRSSCESGRDLCYDTHSGRIVYKPARQYMPELPGLQPESISVKRDRVVFKYSF
jgi:hypothetical protein